MPQVKPVTYKLITTLLQFNLQINLHKKSGTFSWPIAKVVYFFSVVGLGEHYIS